MANPKMMYVPESLAQELEEYSPEPLIRVVMLPKDTNALGFIFGGVILSHLDLAASEQAHFEARQKVVTKVMREVDFVAPVKVGDWVGFYAKTERVGRTSVTVKVLVVADRTYSRNERIKVTSAEIVFVAVDEDGNPTPIPPRES